MALDSRPWPSDSQRGLKGDVGLAGQSLVVKGQNHGFHTGVVKGQPGTNKVPQDLKNLCGRSSRLTVVIIYD